MIIGKKKSTTSYFFIYLFEILKKSLVDTFFGGHFSKKDKKTVFRSEILYRRQYKTIC